MDSLESLPSEDQTVPSVLKTEGEAQDDLDTRLSKEPAPVTTAIIVVNLIFFGVMVATHDWMTFISPATSSVVEFGAMNARYVCEGQSWRFLTSPFVHAGILHLATNMYVLWQCAPLVERLFGPLRFISIYFISAIGGSMVSLLFAPTKFSVGASGAICGLFAAMLTFLWVHREHLPKDFLRMYARIFVFILVYMVLIGVINPGVDTAAHLGGALFGIASAFALMPSRPEYFQTSEREIVAATCLVMILGGLFSWEKHSLSHNPAVIAQARYGAAVDLLRKEAWAEALPLLDQAAVGMPKEVSVFTDRAKALTQLHKYKRAIDDCQYALKLDPKNDNASEVLSLDYHHLGYDQMALDTLSRSLEKDKHQPVALNDRAWYKESLGDYDGAIADCNASLKLDSNGGAAYDTRGLAYFLLHRYDEAIADFNQAIIAQPKEGAGHFHLSVVYRVLGKPDLAQKHAELATEMKYKPDEWEIETLKKIPPK